MRPSSILIVLATIIFSAEESRAQLLRRSSNHCAPVVHRNHAQAVVVQDDVLVLDQQQFIPVQQSPIIIQNNYPPVPQTVSSVYGYQQLGAGYNPFTVDPAEMLREAARLADRQADLQTESLRVYQQLGSDALGQAGMIAQLQARAALIESTKPIVTQSLTTQVTGSLTAPQRSSLPTDQTICLIPDGNGGYKVQIGGAPSLPAENHGDAMGGGSEGLAVVKTRCASCHTGASTNGGGFALFDEVGNLRELTPQEKDRTILLTKLGVMPQGSEPLTDVEFAAVQLLFK